MKKIFVCLVAIGLSLTFIPEMKGEVNSSSNSTLNSYEVKKIVNRLEEIKITSKSQLSPPEKSKLRKEVLSISERIRQAGPVVYISGGALILIIVLLIILL